MRASRPRLDTRARSRAGGAVALLLGLSLIAAALAGRWALGPTVTAAAPDASGGRPNVVVIETDDQTLESMKVMSAVQARIADHGVTFRNSFVNFSLCCPSRATFLTGQYAHNHRVTSNKGPGGGYARFRQLHARNNLAVWLRRGGYYTAMIGKYLNGYGHGGGDDTATVPPGWSEWNAAFGATSQSVYDYDLNDNGRLVHYGTQPGDFKQDVLTSDAVNMINRRAPRPQPFFLWLTYTAPHVAGPEPNPRPPADCHGTAKPAPRDAHVFASEPLPSPPSFNEEDVSDKPAYIQSRPPLDTGNVAEVARRYRCRLESLLSVDLGVERVFQALRATGELDDTLLIFTSDNGFFAGEHRVANGKIFPYEPATRVPLVMRGPGIPGGETARDLAINADLAPTILQATGTRPGLTMDGRSLLPLARHPATETGRALSIESRRFTGIRTERYSYVRYHTGEEELYDLVEDPDQLRNVAGDPSYAEVRSRLADELDRLQDCAGGACRQTPRVSLALDYRLGQENGRRCARNLIRARVEGADAGAAVEVEFDAGGVPVAVDSEPPFRQAMPPLHGLTRVRARVTMIDGREVTLGRRVRACG